MPKISRGQGPTIDGMSPPTHVGGDWSPIDTDYDQAGQVPQPGDVVGGNVVESGQAVSDVKTGPAENDLILEGAATALPEPGVVFRGPGDVMAHPNTHDLDIQADPETPDPVKGEQSGDGGSATPEGSESQDTGAEGAEDDDEDVSPPARSATKAEWVSYVAEKTGQSEDEVAQSTKEDLIAEHGA